MPPPDAINWDPSVSPTEEARRIVSYLVGLAFGRWALIPNDAGVIEGLGGNPFEPIPASPPGMRKVSKENHESLSVEVIADDGTGSEGLGFTVSELLSQIWGDSNDDAEISICGSLKVADIGSYIRKPNGFFSDHLRAYSSNRRQAPIYWPLSTTSGSYTLWVYYPDLSSQTLYTAINDFVEPKLKQVSAGVTALRDKGSARTRDDEDQFEALQALELEMIELRDTLLKLAPTYKPNHDDGVQISAAPLWLLFRHKPWQKVLKHTWDELKKGDYDWAYLAMNYWPERVREKCKTDKSLAIAHGLEHLYIEPEAQPKKTRGQKKAGGDE